MLDVLLMADNILKDQNNGAVLEGRTWWLLVEPIYEQDLHMVTSESRSES
jgi:hypothetical protein